jgi:hypothetical protein
VLRSISHLKGEIMFKTKRFTFFFIALVTLFLVIAAGVIPSPTFVLAKEHRLVGSWQIIDPGSGTFIGLLTADGSGTTTVSSTVSTPAAFVSTAHGVWEKTGQTYSITTRAFLYDAAGNLIFTRKVRSNVQLSQDGQTYTSDVVIDVMQLDGTVIQTLTLTADGIRITPEPL